MLRNQHREVPGRFQTAIRLIQRSSVLNCSTKCRRDKKRTFISLENRLYRGVLVYGEPERIRGVFRLLDLHCPFEYTEPSSFYNKTARITMAAKPPIMKNPRAAVSAK